MKLLKEVKLVVYTAVLYVSFIYWGYLQEKITSTKYISDSTSDVLLWNYPFALNVLMAASAALLASVVEDVCLPLVVSSATSANKKGLEDNKAELQVSPPLMLFARPALTCAMGSPLGYMALDYIPFPLVVLAKSSKPIPVMLIGIFFYRKTYPWYKYVATLLLCGGIVAFSYWKASSPSKSSGASGGSALAGGSEESDGDGVYSLLMGLVLVLMNLSLDGYTNNEQEHIFKMKEYKVSSFSMMKNVNLWQILFLVMYLAGVHFYYQAAYQESSELLLAYQMFVSCAQVRLDIAMFCVCAAVGQLTIFVVMKEFGSLMWITISITRKLFTILVSVVMFNHSICYQQWAGVASVFAGLILEVIMTYSSKEVKEDKKAQSKKND